MSDSVETKEEEGKENDEMHKGDMRFLRRERKHCIEALSLREEKSSSISDVPRSQLMRCPDHSKQ